MSNVQDTNTLTSERRKVLDLHEAGWTVREIATALNVSTQRVYQQLKRLRDEGLITEEASA